MCRPVIPPANLRKRGTPRSDGDLPLCRTRQTTVFLRSARAGVRRTWFLVGCCGSAAARSSLAPVWVPPLRLGRRSPESLRGPSMDAARTAAAKQGVLSRLGRSAAARSSLAPMWVSPPRLGRRSPESLRGPSMDAAQTAAAKQGLLPRLGRSAAARSSVAFTGASAGLRVGSSSLCSRGRSPRFRGCR